MSTGEALLPIRLERVRLVLGDRAVLDDVTATEQFDRRNPEPFLVNLRGIGSDTACLRTADVGVVSTVRRNRNQLVVVEHRRYDRQTWQVNSTMGWVIT